MDHRSLISEIFLNTKNGFNSLKNPSALKLCISYNLKVNNTNLNFENKYFMISTLILK